MTATGRVTASPAPPSRRRGAGHLADLQAETAQDSTNAQFHIQQPSEKLLARNQQPADLLRSNRFGVHWAEPAYSDQLGEPARIFAIGLHRPFPAEQLQIPLASAPHAAIVITA